VTEKTTVRLIMFLDCPRSCPGCCNEYPSIKAQMRPISSLDDLEPYEEVILTGGEPMARPVRTLAFLLRLRKRFPEKPVFLYTAMLHRKALEAAIPHLAGLQYTLHADSGVTEVEDMHMLELLLTMKGNGGSYRLKLDSTMAVPVTPDADVWSSIERKPWRTAGDCVVPPHEDLLIWSGDSP